MTTNSNSKSVARAKKAFLLSLLLLALAIISSMISAYSYVLEEKVYSESLTVVSNTTLKPLDSLSFTIYQLKLVVNVENPPVNVIVKDGEGLVTYHQEFTNTQNLFSISSRELDALTISCRAPSNIVVDIYAVHVRKPYMLLAVLGLAFFAIGFPLSFGSFFYMYLNKTSR